MSVDFAKELSLKYVIEEQPSVLLGCIKDWIFATGRSALLHPLGFFVILLRRSDQEEWRFHVWPKGERHITGMPALIHTHDKIVDSKVLKGELSNINYSVSKACEGGLPVYEVQYAGDKYDPNASNVLRLSDLRVEPYITDQRLVRTGESYRVDAHVFHQAVVPESISTATLVCMHSRSRGTVKLLGLEGYPDRIEFRRSEHSARRALTAAGI